MKQTTNRTVIGLIMMMLTTMTAWATTETVSYIDADGNEQTVTATVLTGDVTADGLSTNAYGNILIPAGWYVVKNSKDGVDASYTATLRYTGDNGTIHLILADGAEMTVSKNTTDVIYLNQDNPLAIYGQSGGTGRLTVTGKSYAINAQGGMTINGGIVNATATDTGSTAHAIYVWNGITINGGQVTATTAGSGKGIYVYSAALTIGCRKASDFVSFNSYYGTVNIKSGQTLYAGATAYSGNNVSLPTGTVTLRPYSSDDFSVNDAGTEYTIKTAEGWNVFCDLLAENTKGYFDGKTVKLGADITVSRMAGGDNHEFTGTFDGGGHTLTVSISNSNGNAAPFREIMGATIRNLKVCGTVSGHKHSAGLVSYARGADSSVENTIENCLVATDVSTIVDTDGDCYLGGIVGHGFNSKLTIRGCAFTGSLTSPHNYTGGLQGWSDGNTLILENDIFAASSVNAANNGFHPIAFHVYNATTTATVTNVYYTVAPTCTTASRIAAAGKQARSITAGQWATVSHAGVANTYSTSGITAYKATGASADSDPFIAGLLYNDDDSDVLYAGSSDVVSLTLTNTAPDGYSFDGYTTNAGTLEGSTLTMPDADVTVNVDTETLRSTRQPVTVTYIKADGTPGEASAIALDGHEAVDEDGDVCLAAGWYFVGKDISYTATLTFGGDVHLILCDGCTMNVGESGAPIKDANVAAIDGFANGDKTFTIYGQTLGTGALNVYASGTTYPVAISVDALTVNGGNIIADFNGTKIANPIFSYGDININRGTVTATATGDESYGIYAYNGTVNINGGTVTANCTENSIYGIAANINGGTITANGGIYVYGVNGDVTINGGNVTASSIYSESGTITLGWTNPADQIYASSYEGTVNIADGKVFTDGNGHNFYGTITDVSTLADKTLQPVTNAVPYIDADGNTVYCTDYTVLTDGGAQTLPGGWYVVNSNISRSDMQLFQGDTHIILADDATMTITQDGDYHGLYSEESSLTIYGQTAGSGALNVTSLGAIYADDNFTINGGNITANGTDIGINAGDNIIINGGNVSATGYPYGIKASGNITLGWTRPADRITASSISTEDGTVKIASGKALVDTSNGNKYYIGDGNTISASDINGKTLKPALLLTDNVDNSAQVSALAGLTTTVILQGRTLYKDGAWNTLCLPFDITDGSGQMAGATAMTLDDEMSGFNSESGVLTLNFDAASGTILAGTPFIVKWTGTDVENPVFTGVTIEKGLNDVTSNDGTVSFKGTYASITYTEENKSILFVGAQNNLYWPTADSSIGAQRAYFELNDGQQARNIVLNFGDDENATGIHSTTNFTRSSLLASLAKNLAGAWYTLDGRKLSGTPTAPGIYVKDGHKVAIKREK